MKNTDKDMRNYVKAKRVDNGEWVEGFLTRMWQQYHIISAENENTAYPVDADTICHCIGICDLAEKKMYEYDIVKHYNDFRFPEKFETGIIIWNQDRMRYEICRLPDLKESYLIFAEYLYETAGSSLDHPELKEAISTTVIL